MRTTLDLPQDLLKEAIETEPFNSDYYVNLADFIRINGDVKSKYIEVDSLFNKAVILNPHNTWAYAGKGWNSKRLGIENSENFFLEGINKNPQKASAYYFLTSAFLKRIRITIVKLTPKVFAKMSLLSATLVFVNTPCSTSIIIPNKTDTAAAIINDFLK